MITVTPHGHRLFLSGITSAARQAHLFVDEGELKGYGYEPLPVEPEQWQDGMYPQLKWTLIGGKEQDILGYYVTDETGAMLWSEPFGEAFTNKQAGGVVTVNMKLNLLASG